MLIINLGNICKYPRSVIIFSLSSKYFKCTPRLYKRLEKYHSSPNTHTQYIYLERFCHNIYDALFSLSLCAFSASNFCLAAAAAADRLALERKFFFAITDSWSIGISPDLRFPLVRFVLFFGRDSASSLDSTLDGSSLGGVVCSGSSETYQKIKSSITIFIKNISFCLWWVMYYTQKDNFFNLTFRQRGSLASWFKR